jgi:DnaK suppressor protein
MERAQLEVFRRTLESMLDTMTRPAEKRAEIAVENAADAIDLVQRAGERELAILRIESDFNRLQSVRLAIERINEGTYGTCLACEREISTNRLRAVPWAAYCVTCQELADRQNRAPEEQEETPFRLPDIA